MFQYDLTGKQVVMVLEGESLAQLEPLGISGSPLVARVFKMEEGGLWLENPRFDFCPAGAKGLYDARGQLHCLAHVFVPARAVLSVAVFPNEVQDLDSDSAFRRIGFKTADGSPA